MLAAGWVDAVVGGGGLIQLPALVLGLPGAAPVHILATNKLGSICGTSVSSVTYYRRVRPDLRTAVPMALVAFLGALGGRAGRLAPAQGRVQPHPAGRARRGRRLHAAAARAGVAHRRCASRDTTTRVAAMGHGLVVGFYDGALGPGTGSFLVFALVGLMGYAFLQASAKAKIANFATNLAALIIFAPRAGDLAGRPAHGGGNLVGGYLGARTAVSRGTGFVRVIFVVVVGAFIVKIGADVVRQLALTGVAPERTAGTLGGPQDPPQDPGRV